MLSKNTKFKSSSHPLAKQLKHRRSRLEENKELNSISRKELVSVGNYGVEGT